MLFRSDSPVISDGQVSARLHLSRGPLYRIDSIRKNGNAKISSHFLQHYLGIPNGSLFNAEKIDDVGRKLATLPYLQEVQPADVQLLGTGSVLNLYLKQKKSVDSWPSIGEPKPPSRHSVSCQKVMSNLVEMVSLQIGWRGFCPFTVI